MLNPPNVLNPAQSVTVAKSGADFTSIQSAIDSITDASSSKYYTIEIYPGEYTENLVLKNYVNLNGVGIANGLSVIGTSGSLLTIPSTFVRCENILFNMNPTANGSKIIDSSAGGYCQFNNCGLFVTSSTNGITGNISTTSSSGTTAFIDCGYFYTMTGTDAGSNTHNLIVQENTSVFTIDRANIQVNISDADDDINIYTDSSTGNATVIGALVSLNANSATYSGTASVFKHTGTGILKLDTRSSISVTSAGNGIGQIFDIDTDTNDGIINSSSNTFSVTGFATNYLADVAIGDTLNSISDIITAANNTTGAGVVNFVNSQEYGQVQITGGGAFTIDTQNEWHAFSTPATGLTSSNVDVDQGSTGAITNTADNGGVLRCTDVDHGLVSGDFVTLTGMGDAAHDGVTQITVINADTFDCDDIAWSSNADTGTWHHGSHIVPLRRGAYRVDYSFSVSSVAVNQVFDFVVFKNTSTVSGTQIQRKFSAGGDVGALAGTGVVFLEKDDHLFFAVRNTTGTGNVTISEGAFNISKVS